MVVTLMKKTVLLSALAGLCLGFTASAYAEKGGNGHGKDKGQSQHERFEDTRPHNDHNHSDHNDDHDNDKALVKILIGDDDRHLISQYLSDDHRRHCPPGLAKKRNGCLPPGIAKKYGVGDRLPDDVVWYPLPDDLRRILKPAPAGYQYVQVDKDVLLIGEATKKVVDAVTLLSAVGE